MPAPRARKVGVQLQGGDVDAELTRELVARQGERIGRGAGELLVPGVRGGDEGRHAAVPGGKRRIHAGKEIGERRSVADAGGGARGQPVPVLDDALEPRQVRFVHGHPRQTFGRLAHIGSRGRLRETLNFGRDEEVHPVLHHRPAERKTGLQPVVGARPRDDAVAGELVVAPVGKAGAAELVGTRLGHGIDERAGETAVAHVVRRHEHLVFLHRIERNGFPDARRRRDGPVQHVLAGAVDQKGVEPEIGSRAGHSSPPAADLGRHVGREGDEVLEVPVERRQSLHQRFGNRWCPEGLPESLPCPCTSTASSSTTAGSSTKATLSGSPSVRWSGGLCCGANPICRTSTTYGPPGSSPWTRKRPPTTVARTTNPVAVFTTRMDAPSRSRPSDPRTLPRTPPVVRPWAFADGVPDKNKSRSAAANRMRPATPRARRGGMDHGPREGGTGQTYARLQARRGVERVHPRQHAIAPDDIPHRPSLP